MRFTMCSVLLLACVAPIAYADTMSPTKANGTLVFGSGIANGNDFTASHAIGGESVYARVRPRDGSPTEYQNGNQYGVLPGNAPSSTSPYWSVDFQFTPPLSANLGDYRFMVEWDTNPAYGSASFTTINLPTKGANSWNTLTDSVLVNPGTWSTPVTEVLGNSWNSSFSFLDPGFNRNALGEYEFRFSVLLPNNSVVASTTVFAQVIDPQAVPEASTIVALFSMVPVGAFMLFRRYKASKQ
jgi:hypothetical protein